MIRPLSLKSLSLKSLSLKSLSLKSLCLLAGMTCSLSLVAQSALSAPLPELGYNLAHNLANAHRFQDGVLIDLNDVSGVKYLRNKTWIYTDYQGRAAALPQGIQAKVWVPITRELSGKKLAIDVVLAPTGPKQLVDIFIGSKKIKSVVFKSADWQTVRALIPADLAREGIQRIKLHFRRRHTLERGGKTPAAFRALRVGLASRSQLPVDEAQLKSLFKREQRGHVALAPQQGLDYYVVPSKAASTLQGTVSGGEVEVWAQVDAKRPQKLKRVSGDFKVSLKSFINRPTRLMVRAQERAVTLDAQIGGHDAARTPEVKRPKYVIFWLIDTLRADKLKFYNARNSNGRRKVKTPHLSALANESVVFEPFYVQGNESKASHASLFTGTYPVKHGVYTHKAKLPNELTTIAEMFKRLKYHTGGYVSNGYVSDRWNYAQATRIRERVETTISR